LERGRAPSRPGLCCLPATASSPPRLPVCLAGGIPSLRRPGTTALTSLLFTDAQFRVYLPPFVHCYPRNKTRRLLYRAAATTTRHHCRTVRCFAVPPVPGPTAWHASLRCLPTLFIVCGGRFAWFVGTANDILPYLLPHLPLPAAITPFHCPFIRNAYFWRFIERCTAGFSSATTPVCTYAVFSGGRRSPGRGWRLARSPLPAIPVPVTLLPSRCRQDGASPTVLLPSACAWRTACCLTLPSRLLPSSPFLSL